VTPRITIGLPSVQHAAGVSTLDRADLLGAQSDVDAVRLWLSTITNPSTHRAYQRESDRIIVWCDREQKSLKNLKMTDWLDFYADLEMPNDHHLYIASTIDDSAMRVRYQTAFCARHKNTAIGKFRANYSKIVLSQMCTWLVKRGYLVGNAVPEPYREDTATQFDARIGARTLTNDQDDIAMRVVQMLSWDVVAEARMRFVITWLAATGCRRSELGAATTTQLYRESDKHPQTGEPLTFVYWKRPGKGKKLNHNAVSESAVNALIRYRLALNKPPSSLWDGPDEPLIMHLHGNLGSVSRRREPHHASVDDPRGDNKRRYVPSYSVVCNIVKEFGLLVAATMEYQNSDRFLEMTPHWFRHRLVRKLLSDPSIAPADAQAQVNHASLSTTSAYGYSDVKDTARRLRGKIPAPPA
jgi:integrase